MIIVRIAKPEDSKEIQEITILTDEILRRVYRPNETALKHKTCLERRLTRLVATFDGKIAGTVQYYLSENRLHIIGLAVHPDFHRKGVARKMIDCLAEIAGRSNINKLSLHTVKETSNVPIFNKLGFEIISEEIDEFSESDKFEKLIDVNMEKII